MRIKSVHVIVITGLWLMCVFQSCKKAGPANQLLNEAKSNLTNTTTAADSASNLPNALSWSAVQGQPVATHEVHGEAVNNKLYIFGGFDVNKRPNTWSPTKRAYVYDPVTNKWASIKSLPYTPNGDGFGGATHMGVTTDGTNIYFAGGYVSNANGTGQVFGTNQVWKYIVATDTYEKLPNLPQALAAGQLRYLNGKLHYMGGANMARQDINLHYVLDLNAPGGWQTAAPLLDAVNHPGSAVLNGKIYFIGGAHHQDENTVTQKMLQVYDPAADSWQRLADMPLSVDHVSSSVITFGNHILVLGGETAHNVLTKKVQEYWPETNTWSELTQLPAARSAGVAAVLNGNIYYTGGNFSNINRQGIPVVEITPTADAFVRGGTYAANNFGADSTLTVKASPNDSYDRKAYLKFSLSGITTVASAKIRVYGLNEDNATTPAVYCYGVNDDNWLENTINFSTAPVNVTASLSNAPVSNTAGFVEFDVTGFVKAQLSGDKTASFVFKDPLNKNVTLQFKSKESIVNKPVLIIQSN